VVNFGELHLHRDNGELVREFSQTQFSELLYGGKLLHWIGLSRKQSKRV
jgi:hypothetical protein